MRNERQNDTIAAIATPPGEGGIAIVRISGACAGEFLRAAFRPAHKGEMKHGQMRYGTLTDPAGAPIDEVMAVFFRAPRSYTREDVAEIHLHGGSMCARAAMERLLSLGARAAEPGEFTYRAFMNGRVDLSEAEAVMGLIGARSQAARRASIRQLRGGVSAPIGRMREELTGLLAKIEAATDFPDEIDEDVTAKDVREGASRIRNELSRAADGRRARIVRDGASVVLCGRPNVGKSSLMNALCGPSVAEADMLFATLDPTSRKLVLPSGMAVLLVDTVGFVSRLPHNLVEAFKSTLEEAAWSDVIIRVADAGDEQREEQLAVTDEVLDGLDCTDIPRLTVYNKCDKPNTLSFDPDILLTSAKTGYGLDTLLQKLDELLSDRVHTIRVLLPYDKLGLAAPMRERGSVQVEEYREDGLYLEGIVKTEDLHCFEGYLV